MKTKLSIVLLVCSLSSSYAHADITLEYALSSNDDTIVTKKISIARFFARVDSSDQPDEYLLYQAGKYHPLYRVNTKESTYTLLTSSKPKRSKPQVVAAPAPESTETKTKSASEGPAGSQTQAATQTQAQAAATQPDSAKPAKPAAKTGRVFKPKRINDRVAGVKCRVVLEMVNDAPAVEHCMANKAGLGITERESRTLARLFVMANKQGYDWLATATEDEDFVSVRTQLPDQPQSLKLLSVSTKPLERGYLKVPAGFKLAPAAAPPKSAPTPAAEAAVDATSQENNQE